MCLGVQVARIALGRNLPKRPAAIQKPAMLNWGTLGRIALTSICNLDAGLGRVARHHHCRAASNGQAGYGFAVIVCPQLVPGQRNVLLIQGIE